MDLELVAEGLEFPEGPVAMSDGSVIVTEIAAGRITRIAADGSKEVLVETGGGPNGAAIGPDGALWITNNGGSFAFRRENGLLFPGPTPPSHEGGMIQRYDFGTRRLETIYEACDGTRLLAPNDIVFDRAGGFWFTDHGCSIPGGRKYGALYYGKGDGSGISRIRSGLISPNGVGLSPDEKVVYFADTHLGRLWALDLMGPGEARPTTGWAPARVVCNLPDYQLLDSLAVEASGRICVATIVNGGITVFDVDGGYEHVPVPDMLCTNICFGGEDMRDAWITASSTGRLYRMRWSRPGLRLNFNA